MQTEEIFYRYISTVVYEWYYKTADWPQIEAALEGLQSTDIAQEKALALLIGLRAGERQKEQYPRKDQEGNTG
jgi:hypothetical protein